MRNPYHPFLVHGRALALLSLPCRTDLVPSDDPLWKQSDPNGRVRLRLMVSEAWHGTCKR